MASLILFIWDEGLMLQAELSIFAQLFFRQWRIILWKWQLFHPDCLIVTSLCSFNQLINDLVSSICSKHILTHSTHYIKQSLHLELLKSIVSLVCKSKIGAEKNRLKLARYKMMVSSGFEGFQIMSSYHTFYKVPFSCHNLNIHQVRSHWGYSISIPNLYILHDLMLSQH